MKFKRCLGEEDRALALSTGLEWQGEQMIWKQELTGCQDE